MGPKNDPCLTREMRGTSPFPCLAPHDPRNLWQFFDKIEQNEKRKWTRTPRSECICCGHMYWDFTPSKILEHFGLQSTRETAAKSVTGARVSSSC